MNKVALIGRITKEIELRYREETAIARFTLAVDRNKEETDFIPCVAFKKVAETLHKYCDKGCRIAVEGRIQTGSYEKNGAKIYTTDVIVERQEIIDFREKKKASEDKEDDFVKVSEMELPFN